MTTIQKSAESLTHAKPYSGSPISLRVEVKSLMMTYKAQVSFLTVAPAPFLLLLCSRTTEHYPPETLVLGMGQAISYKFGLNLSSSSSSPHSLPSEKNFVYLIQYYNHPINPLFLLYDYVLFFPQCILSPYIKCNLPPNDSYGLTFVTYHCNVRQSKAYVFIREVQKLEQYITHNRYPSIFVKSTKLERTVKRENISMFIEAVPSSTE